MKDSRREIAEFISEHVSLTPEEAEAFVETPRESALGDLAFPCFKLAKELKKAPPAIASDLAGKFVPTSRVTSAEATGPYLNFRLDRTTVAVTVLADPAAATSDGSGETVVLDYASPNISKQLAYHHLPSATIGFSLKRIFEQLGYRAVGINHLGDWGTSHGKLIAAWKRWGEGVDLSTGAVRKLNELYVRFNAEEDAGEGQEWFRKLEEGDPEARSLWKMFRDVSYDEISEVYDHLGITFDEVRGESEYVNDLDDVIALFTDAGLATVSEGALVIEFGEGPPFFLRKSDGATVYGTRDLAAALHRFEKYGFSRCLYVVDMGQAFYFKQLFTVLDKLGKPWASRMEHVDFGVVQFAGVKTSTRTGNVVLLRDVVEEAVARIDNVIKEKNPDLPDRAGIARKVGVGAIIFSYLSSRRQKDFDFVWEDVLNFDGHTGPYVQYTHARCASILRKAADLAELESPDLTNLTLPEEWETVKLLAQFPDRVRLAARDAEPSTIAQYLLGLCESFSTYYNLGSEDASKKVLSPDPRVTSARLALVEGVRAVLERGLSLLGVEAPEEM